MSVEATPKIKKKERHYLSKVITGHVRLSGAVLCNYLVLGSLASIWQRAGPPRQNFPQPIDGLRSPL